MAAPIIARLFVGSAARKALSKDRPTQQLDAKMSFDVRNNAKEFKRGLNRMQKEQLPFAMSLALNDTAADVAQTQKKQAAQVFDRPTPFFLRGIAAKKGFKGVRATKRRLIASVIPGYAKSGFQGPGRRVNDAMKYQAEGGTRTARGLIPVPTRALKTNKYGNLRRNQVKQVLNRKTTFQAGAAEGVKPGIYQRTKDGPKMLISYNNSVSYSPRFPFERIGRGVSKSKFDRNLSRAMKRALRTRK